MLPRVWPDAYSQMFDHEIDKVSTHVIDDVKAQEFADQPDTTARTEGGHKYSISRRAERDLSLRNDAIKLHGLSCHVCGFNYQETYGEWGSGFIEVHHARPLGGADGQKVMTNPKHDLAVVCANCHRMLHRKTRFVLTIEELRAKVRAARQG